jgi:hypothetical protein
MKTVQALGMLGMALMGVTIGYGLAAGDFGLEGAQLLGMPWGIVSLVDLSTGFLLFAAWVVFREQNWLRSILWIGLLLGLGFFTGSLYVFLAARSSGGSWEKFFMGRRAGANKLWTEGE